MKKSILFAIVSLCLAKFSLASVLTINDGQFNCNTWESAYAYQNINDTVVINGGQFNGIATEDYGLGFMNSSEGTVIVTGGYFNGKALHEGIGLLNLGKATINGGEFYGRTPFFDSYGFFNRGIATIYGGIFTGITTNNFNCYGFYNLGFAVIYGGIFRGDRYSDIYNRSTLVICGAFSQYGELPQGNGFFSGTLADGTYTTINYINHGSMYLLPVPEPNSTLVLLCSIFGMGGIIWKRKVV